MRCISLSIGVLLAGASLAWAFDEPKKKPPAKDPPATGRAEKKDQPSEKTVAEQIEAVQQELAEKQQEIVNKYQAAQDDAERKKLYDEYYALPSKLAVKYAAIVKQHPDDEAVFPGLQVMMSSKDHAQKAADIILKHHLGNQQLGSLCLGLVESDDANVEKLIRAVAGKAKSDDVKGQATLALGQMLYARSNADGLDDARRDKLREEAEAALEKVVEHYPDVAAVRGKAGDVASGVLFEVQHLAVGREVPDLEGEDLDGAEFKLSDYRGKVVFLDFWAHW